MPQHSTVYRFGPYELRTGTRELYKQGVKLKLRPQPFQVLKTLVERSGQVVSREELRERLWSTETFVDFEHGLNTSIKELRGVLNDSASEPRYIQTVPRLGYRILVPVEVESLRLNQSISPPETAVMATPAAKENALHGMQQVLVVRRWPILLGISMVLIAGLVAYSKWSRTRLPSTSGRWMMAVLPFENLTGDAAQEYFSDGFTEEMISQLGRLDPERLGVIARTSVMHYKNNREPLEQIARELGVQYVLEGSVRRNLDQVRISAQLIQMKDQTHLWARQYDRQVRDLLAVQGEIAQQISDEIQRALKGRKPVPATAQASLSPEGYEAYNLYLQGQYFWNKRTVEGFREAIHYFEQATAKDPNCARAYTGLADSYALFGGYSSLPQTAFAGKARAAALRALEIDESLPEAHTALALIVQNYDWDWQRAEKEYRRAIELNPNYATAHHWYAEHLAWRGRFEEALRESEVARQLDPLSLIIAADKGVILYLSRQYDRAIGQFRYVLDLEQHFPRAHVIRSAYVEKGMFTEALADVEQERRASGVASPWTWAALAFVYGRSGRQSEAQHAMEKLLQLNQRQPCDAGVLAWAYIGVGNKEQALDWLEKAAAQQSNVMTGLKVDPVFDPLRREPRFQTLLHRAGLAQ